MIFTNDTSISSAKDYLGIDDNSPDFIPSDKVALNLNIDEKNLIQKYNRFMYTSTHANKDKTYLKIGPHIYGGEVQGIRIVENKAIDILPGVRSSTDFLSDSGDGDADVQVTLVFSGSKHIVSGLIPLIALFKISPITSVKNSLIESALYNRFTEGAIQSPDKLLFDRAGDVLDAGLRAVEYNKIRALIGGSGPLSEQDFHYAQKIGVESVLGKTYKDWKNDLDNLTYFKDNPTIAIDLTRESVDNAFESARHLPVKLDKTGHVPVAMSSIRVSTHPELPETLVVVLSLKRIGVGNFLRDYLQYRDIKNNPTPDARRAFWLNRAIDTYIDRYTPSNLMSFDHKRDELFGIVKLQFIGDDIELELFSDTHNLKAVNLNDKANNTVVTGMSYMLSNKFAFKRLQGESYPTAQFMGVSSGLMSMSLTTNDPDKLKELHTYKSAADFFIRATDRASRFNGWRIKSFISSLFNTKENSEAINSDDVTNTRNDNKLYYPINFLTSSHPELPGTRNVSITFGETAIDMFTEYGFTLYGNGMSLEIVHDFYKTIFEKSTKNEDRYATFIMYGSGENKEKYSIFNPQTLMSAFVEKDTFKNSSAASGIAGFRSTDSSLATSILKSYLADPKISGVLNSANAGLDLVIEQMVDINLIEIFGSDPLTVSSPKLSDEIATRMLNWAFIFDDSIGEPLKAKIKEYLASAADPDAREDLYSLLHPRLITGKITLTNDYAERLFASIVKRSRVPLSDRLYEREGVSNAYDGLERAIIIRGDLINEKANNALIKSAATEKSIVSTPRGGVDVRNSRISAYTDYIYITYEEMFNLPEIKPDLQPYWKNFAYTYHDMGIINTNGDAYTADPNSSLNDGDVQHAQFEFITKANSPIPPSVYFYRERELESIRDYLKKESKEWSDHLKVLRVDLSYDIEYLVREAGRYSGKRVSADNSPDNLLNPESLTLPTMIERMHQYAKNSKSFNEDTIRKAGVDATIAQYRRAKLTYGSISPNNPGIYANLSDADLHALLNDVKNKTQKDKFINYIKDVDNVDVVVPLLLTTNFGKSVASYSKVSGTRGAAIYRTAITLAAKTDNRTVEEFIGDSIATTAMGLDDGIGLTNLNSEESHNIMLKITQSVPDNRNDIIKAFPVFKLYLIDYNGGDRIFVRDNFYGYNAIISIDITQDKNDADLAVIRIADPLQLIQGSFNKDLPSLSRGVVDGIVLPSSSEDKFANNFLSRFELKQGRAVQIRAGYSADPENLDVVFTGRIAEVSLGDVVTIVAQGWKAELLGKQVEFELSSVENSSVKDLVVRTVRDANPAGLGQILTQEEFNNLRKISGGLAIDGAIVRSIQNQQGTLGGQSGYSGLEGITFFGSWNLGGNSLAGVDLRLKNIWTPDTNKALFNPLADVETSGWEGRSWLIPMQPAWDVLQNATNYGWGYICQIVPYDGEGTLFFGKPDQLYYYTRGEPKANSQYRKSLDRSEQDVSKDFRSLFDGFISSSYYKNFVMPPLYRVGKQESNYITDPVKIIVSGVEGTIQPELIGYSLYREFANMQIGNNKTLFPDRSGESNLGIAPFFELNLTDLRPKNYALSFNKDLEYIATALGGEEKAAYLMFCSFFGLGIQYSSENFYPVYTIVNSYMATLSESSIFAIRQKIINNVQPDQKYVESNEKIGFLKKEEVDQALNVLEDQQFLDMMAIKFNWETTYSSGSISFSGPFFNSSLDFTEEQTNKSIIFLQALQTFFESNPSLIAIYPSLVENESGEPYEIKNVSLNTASRTYLDVYINGNTNQLEKIASTLNSDNSKKLIAAVLRSFKAQQRDTKELDFAIRSTQVYDPDFAKMATIINPGFDSAGVYSSQDRADQIISDLPLFRAYIHFFKLYLELNAIHSKPAELQSVKASGLGKFPPALNMKCFRDFHYISSGVDIIENNIAASTREMHNTVVIRHPLSVTTNNDSWWKLRIAQGDYDSAVVEDLQWTSWPTQDETQHMGFQFNENISLANKKIYVHTDLNIRSRDQAAKAATNILPKLVRPMYRNNIMIMGRAIKPWDQIYLDDKFIDMFGPIEVERCIHHYSVHEGWTTNIIPHAVCEANPGNSTLQIAIWNAKMDIIYNAVDVALWGIVIASAIPTMGASVGLIGLSGRTIVNQIIKKNLIPLVPSALNKRLGEKLAVDFASAGGITAKLNILKSTAVGNAPTIAKAFVYGTTAQWAAGSLSRGFMANAGSSDMRQPVIIAPLLFKGIPFEAGLNGQENSYWSLSSKLHWGYNDLIKGIEHWGLYIQDVFGQPTPGAVNAQLQALGNDTNNAK